MKKGSYLQNVGCIDLTFHVHILILAGYVHRCAKYDGSFYDQACRQEDSPQMMTVPDDNAGQ